MKVTKKSPGAKKPQGQKKSEKPKKTQTPKKPRRTASPKATAKPKTPKRKPKKNTAGNKVKTLLTAVILAGTALFVTGLYFYNTNDSTFFGTLFSGNTSSAARSTTEQSGTIRNSQTANRTTPDTAQETPASKNPFAKLVLPFRRAAPVPGVSLLGKVAFVIDDAGHSLRELEPFLQFQGPLTIAVLPGLPDSSEAARRIRAAGKELFLHQPMESIGGHDPGPNAIFTGMSETEIRSIVNRNLDELWPVAGINNHEGSKISTDQRIMEIILGICRERGIVFLDSRTTADSRIPMAANSLGIQIRERDIFLDNDPNRNSIISNINQGLTKAEQQGSAIMIGHVFTAELAPILNEFYAAWLKQGYTLTTVSGLF